MMNLNMGMGWDGMGLWGAKLDSYLIGASGLVDII